MFFYYLVDTLTFPFGLIFRWFFKLWNRLDNETKKLIIETFVQGFKEIIRAWYKWWKSKRS